MRWWSWPWNPKRLHCFHQSQDGCWNIGFLLPLTFQKDNLCCYIFSPCWEHAVSCTSPHLLVWNKALNKKKLLSFTLHVTYLWFFRQLASLIKSGLHKEICIDDSGLAQEHSGRVVKETGHMGGTFQGKGFKKSWERVGVLRKSSDSESERGAAVDAAKGKNTKSSS